MELKECKECMERSFGHGPVPGHGNPKLAKICLLGRNPGVTEDLKGVPFVGRAGGKLNTGLVLAHILRNECYVTNMGKCYTPTSVKPSAKCYERCKELWLCNEMRSLEKLKLIVTLGNEALKYFEPLASVGELHGYPFPAKRPWGKLLEESITVFVSYHPSAALRSSIMNKHFMKDMSRLHQLWKELDA